MSAQPPVVDADQPNEQPTTDFANVIEFECCSEGPALEATFVPDAIKAQYVEALRKYCDGWRPPPS